MCQVPRTVSHLTLTVALWGRYTITIPMLYTRQLRGRDMTSLARLHSYSIAEPRLSYQSSDFPVCTFNCCFILRCTSLWAVYKKIHYDKKRFIIFSINTPIEKNHVNSSLDVKGILIKFKNWFPVCFLDLVIIMQRKCFSSIVSPCVTISNTWHHA